MPAPFVTRPPLSRRSFLRGAGVALSLPWLDAMVPAASRAAAVKAAAEAPCRSGWSLPIETRQDETRTVR